MNHVNILFTLLTAVVTVRLTAQTELYYAPMTINNVSAWYSSNGAMEYTHGFPTVLQGAVFPRNTAGVSLMSSYIYVVDSVIPAAYGPYYTNLMHQGSIIGFRTGVTDDPFSTDLRIWRVRKDFATADLRRDAAVTYGMTERSVSILDMQRLRTQYKKDWIEWPAFKGAPYYDRNGNGIYDPKFIINSFGVEVPDTASDAPGLADADQVIWAVYNDILSTSSFGSQPLGMETQLTVWGYAADGAMGNTLFRRCRMIYKGTAATPAGHTIGKLYLAHWSDLDNGSPSDDLAGSDSTVGLAYVYNSRVMDTEFLKFNTVPPAIGIDILQGPIVKGGTTDSALVNFSYRKGWKNLAPSSIIISDQVNFDPGTGAAGAQQFANAVKGLMAFTGEPRNDPQTGIPSRFWNPGEPQTRVGWVDGVSVGAGDRSVLLSMGPFTMTVGDTQEVVTAFIGASSPDRLASVGVLKYHDKIVQETFTNRVAPPLNVPAPTATVSAFDRSLIIEWEKDTAGINRTEKYSSRGYQFEGYELFQLPSARAPLSSGVKVAAVDLKNEVFQVVEEEVDEATGRVIFGETHRGSNSGITRYFQLLGDSIRREPFVNGQSYFYAFRSYAVTADTKTTERSIESPVQYITAVPHRTDPETVLPYGLRDSVMDTGENVVGNGDGRIGLRILDPYAIKGGTYDIWYGQSGSASTWTLVRNAAGTEYASITARLTASELTAPRPNPLPTTTGTVTFTVNDARDQISYTIAVNTVNTVTSIEFYTGQKNTIGLLVKKIVTAENAVNGVWTFSDAVQPLTSSLVKDLIAGNLYVLVRTKQYTNGEVRGQLYDGMLPRAVMPIPDYSTSDRSVMTFTENRLPNEGFSLFVSPAPIGFRYGQQVAPSAGNVINTPNAEGTYFMRGPGYAWGASRAHESIIEFRFTADTNWAITTAKIPAETKYIRVPFRIYKDSIRVVPVIENTLITDSVWNTRGNSFLNGIPLFDKIAGIADVVDFSGNPIHYDTVFHDHSFPTSNSLRGRLINGVNHIAKDIVFVNVKGDGLPPAAGTVIRLTPYQTIEAGDIKRFTVRTIQKGSVEAAKQNVSAVNVFPNPYYGVNRFESGLTDRYVTFSHLPRKATIRIFSLAGITVRTMEKDSPEQFFRWDLKNHAGSRVASSVYLVHIDMGDVGTVILKLAVIMEQEQIDSY